MKMTFYLFFAFLLLLSGVDCKAQGRRMYFGVEYELNPTPSFVFHGGGNPVRWDNVALYAGYFTDRYTSVEAFTTLGEFSDRNYLSKEGLYFPAEYVITKNVDRFLFATAGIRLNLGSSYSARGVRWYFLLGTEGIFFGAPYRERSITYYDGILDSVLTRKWGFPIFRYQGWGITLLGFRLIVPTRYIDLSWTSQFTIPVLKWGWNDMPDATLLSSTVGVQF